MEQELQDGHVLIYQMQIARAASMRKMLAHIATPEYIEAAAIYEASTQQRQVAEEELSECITIREHAPKTGDLEKVLVARAAVDNATEVLNSAEINIQALRGDFFSNVQPLEMAATPATAVHTMPATTTILYPQPYRISPTKQKRLSGKFSG